MTGRRERTQTNQIFFSVIFAANLIFFAAIAILEYRAYRIAKLSGLQAGLEIEITSPKDPHQTEAWRAASAEARRLYVAGRSGFRKCGLCHGIDDVARNFGPNLKCVGARRIADAEALPNTDFRFSAALLRLSEQEGRWTLPLLVRFIADPSAFDDDQVGFTRMPFPGLVKCGGDECKSPLTSGQRNVVTLRNVTHYLYWSCVGAPAFEDLRLITVSSEGSCTQKAVAGGEALVGDNAARLLLPQALPECG